MNFYMNEADRLEAVIKGPGTTYQKAYAYIQLIELYHLDMSRQHLVLERFKKFLDNALCHTECNTRLSFKKFD